ncbi:MAG TPA: two-component regulator propeller domain-containing protein, partial [Flavobacteriales bacterium]|nr:two-component regulator propeller domain-containing protein [Flavobacteriales bacterium]
MLRFATSCIVVLWSVLGHAQQHAFKQYTSKDGLAQSQVRAMAQDAEGYLWFGTLGGASRFDGQYFTNIALQDGLPDAQVSAMARRSDGTFWMGSGNSLARIDGKRVSRIELPASSNGARILGLVAGVANELYIGTDGGGMFMMKD